MINEIGNTVNKKMLQFVASFYYNDMQYFFKGFHRAG
jgi:hypothetical protein